ncbi:MAG: histone deacetylase [Actinomycetota bacterium]|nr:histone deacetylase [Actinomycetota bacterium]
MRVLLYHHDVFAKHDTGPWHPERPDRLVAAVAGVVGSGLDVIRREPGRASLDTLWEIHTPSYVRRIEQFCKAGGGALDGDTVVSEDSWEAALRSAGAGIDAAAALRAGEAECAFLAVRPPGHHARAAEALGFCLFNNIAVTAASLAAQGERVAIVDWDVHHGNGTQETFYENGSVVYLSLHEFPFYPGTGWIDEDGEQAGSGHIINLPFPARTGGDVYAVAMERVILPVIREFDPHWVLVSSGFDAHRNDPLADQMLVDADYGRMAAALASVAPAGRTIFFLEGGYDLQAIEAASAAVLRGTAGLPFGDEPPEESPHRSHQILELVAGKVAADWGLS